MARISFTIKKTGLITEGSFLQNTPAADDDSALRGDAYVTAPDVGLTESQSFFDATVVDYGLIRLKWGIGTALQTTVGATPVPTEVAIRYDTIGEPQTYSNGTLVTTITAGQVNASIDHGDLPLGTWVYYSLFVKYESTGYRSWYEKVASTHVLIPNRYESSEMLWRRIPRHYRIQDGTDSSTVPSSSELYEHGPLYRTLSVFGWDIDKIRTLVHHQMVTRDPMLATTEALDAMAEELGIEMSSVDLGTERLRNILADIGYLRKSKGTSDGVQEWLTAISGSDVRVNPTRTNRLTSIQSGFDGTITNTTNDSLLPTGNTWVFYSTNVTAAASTNGVALSKSTGSGYELVVAKALISDVNQGSWYSMFYDVTNCTNASVVGVAFSPTNITAASVTINSSTGAISSELPPEISPQRHKGETWYQAPVDLGLKGNGTFTTAPMYLHVFISFGPSGSSLALNNVKLYAMDRWPYEIDIYSQRTNLVRDPQFHYGSGSSYYWTGSFLSGSGTVYAPTGYLSASSGSGASVMFRTNSSAGSTPTHIPIRIGIPYYLTVTDRYDNVESVSLKSITYGTIATATSTFAEKSFVNGAKRKTWEFERLYESPWLPRNIEDCYIEITGVLPSGGIVSITEPVFEALNSSGTYFDGDSINGGWLAGPSASSGVADYRWGDAGQHISFSYFTSDYQRTVTALYRLLPSIIPVTQTDDPVDILNLDRVYGYTGIDRP